MTRKRNLVIIFMYILLLSSFGKFLFADVPSIEEIIADVNEEVVLSLKIKHSSPSSNHFIDKIQVDVDDNIYVFNFTMQSLTEFLVNVTVDVAEANVIQVRAHCNLHGWSTWKILKNNGEEPTDETGGIPGYPFESIFLSIILVGILLSRKYIH